jgi:rSAM/selenodomain-associated transferase 1
MRALFGDDLVYTPQGGGDVGRRMARALEDALAAGAPAAIVVGTDVPALDARDVRSALARLRTHDVVLGPAADGGYYLLGLKVHAPHLFVDIDWGTSRVRAQTLAAAARRRLTVSRLRTLADVDEPGDVTADLLRPEGP